MIQMFRSDLLDKSLHHDDLRGIADLWYLSDIIVSPFNHHGAEQSWAHLVGALANNKESNIWAIWQSKVMPQSIVPVQINFCYDLNLIFWFHQMPKNYWGTMLSFAEMPLLASVGVLNVEKCETQFIF